MNELILFIIVAIVLLCSQFLLKSLAPKTKLITRLAATGIMLILLWVFSADTKIAPRVIISTIVLSYAISELRKYYNRQSS